jgi:hypothetical protein
MFQRPMGLPLRLPAVFKIKENETTIETIEDI